ncbi:MAG: SDR family oxidoreductase [Anaerolineae bacterium]|nr:SDR family oxidoreductase [Anaerolineae bacterium]
MSTLPRPVIAIIGASGGIGRPLAEHLAQQGYRLHLGARRADPLQSLATELGASAHALDATDISAVDRFVAAAVEQHGQVDGLVNLAGSILLKPAHQTRDEEWHTTLAQNLTSAFATVKAAGKHMRKQGGAVVLMSSGVARAGFPNHEAISAAKAGVIGLAQSAAASYASFNIRVNAVAPGLVQTPLAEPVTNTEAGMKASLQMHALNRLGEPATVAAMIAWLLDPAHDWVTGQVFGVDGGLGTVRPKIRM